MAISSELRGRIIAYSRSPAPAVISKYTASHRSWRFANRYAGENAPCSRRRQIHEHRQRDVPTRPLQTVD